MCNAVQVTNMTWHDGMEGDYGYWLQKERQSTPYTPSYSRARFHLIHRAACWRPRLSRTRPLQSQCSPVSPSSRLCRTGSSSGAPTPGGTRCCSPPPGGRAETLGCLCCCYYYYCCYRYYYYYYYCYYCYFHYSNYYCYCWCCCSVRMMNYCYLL